MTYSGLSTIWRKAIFVCFACAFLTPAIQAQPYPSKPITLVLPNSAGSAVDTFARQLSVPLAAALGQPVVVQNFPGSGGLIGIQQILRSPKDGYTIGMVASNYTVGPILYNLPYDASKDIVPVSILNSGPLVLLVNPKLPVKNLGEFIALAKSRSANASLTFGSAGVGTTGHLAGEVLAISSASKLLHVPYKGNNNFVTDLIGGQLDAGFITPGVALPFIKAGTLRAIGISTPDRIALLPDVPTLAEAGLANFNVGGWQALVVANGTPKAVIQRLNTELARIVKSKELEKWIADSGARAIGSTVEQAADWFARDFTSNAKLARELGIKPE